MLLPVKFLLHGSYSGKIHNVTAIQDWLTSRIAMKLIKQGAMMTVLSSLLTALAWPAALLSVTDFIDSKWTIAVDRSDKVGKLLAQEVLLKGLHGQRYMFLKMTLMLQRLVQRVFFQLVLGLACHDLRTLWSILKFVDIFFMLRF